MPHVKRALRFMLFGVLVWREQRERRVYTEWLAKYEPEVAQDSGAPTYVPLISIITPTYNTPLVYLKSTIDSVVRQTYQNWELILVDDASPDESVRGMIEEVAAVDPRIKFEFLPTNHHIAGATNIGIQLAKGEFVALLDHDDVLHANALMEVARALNDNQELDFLYTDEDKILEDARLQPLLKPGWNPDFLHAVNYITHFAVIRKSVLNKVGYEDAQYNGAQDWELFLRVTRHIDTHRVCHIPKLLYGWRLHEDSTSKDFDSKPYVVEAQRRAIEDDFKERGITNFNLARDITYPGQWVVNFRHESHPKVTVILDRTIAAQARTEITNNTSYENYELLESDVSNESLSKIVDQAASEYIVIVKDELAIQSETWLETLLGDASRDDIGFVVAEMRAERDVLENLEDILGSAQVDLLRSLSRRNVAKHLYLTTRYNIRGFSRGVVMIRADKLLQAQKGQEKAGIDLKTSSRQVAGAGLRNLYNPYVKVLK